MPVQELSINGIIYILLCLPSFAHKKKNSSILLLYNILLKGPTINYLSILLLDLSSFQFWAIMLPKALLYMSLGAQIYARVKLLEQRV